MFQYAFARLLSKRWRFAMRASPIPGMAGSAGLFPGRILQGPLEVLAGSACELLSSGTLLRPQHLQESLNARVVVHGWFQRVEYLIGSEENWETWFRQEITDEGDGSLALCLRTIKPAAWSSPGMHAGNSGPWPGLTPTVTAIARLLAALRPRKVTIFSDTLPGPEIHEILAPYGYAYDGTWTGLDTPAALRRLRGFRHIAGSVHHSFEWWAGQLNQFAEVWLHDPFSRDCRDAETPGHR